MLSNVIKIALIPAPAPAQAQAIAHPNNWNSHIVKFTTQLGSCRNIATTATAILAAAALIIASPAPSAAVYDISEQGGGGESESTLSNIPQTLSGECVVASDCKTARIQRPKSRKAESCTIKCVGTCIRGGEGSPGEGPLNIRRPLVVFKEGFRTRQYCLVECSDICNLIGDGDDGP